MKAAVLPAIGKPLRIEEVPAPAAQAGEVLIEVEACGVCHSDLHMAQGDWPDTAAAMTFPAVLGHEVVGRVVETGGGVGNPKVGERVGVGWLNSTCGACEPCRDGHENVCLDRTVTGIAAPGGYAEFMRARASHAIPLPDGLPPVEAAPLFCAGLTVYHACRNAGVRGGQRVGVFGVGGLGHLAVQLARHWGAEVTAVDVADDKLKLARSLGAAHAIDVSEENAGEKLARAGFHIAVVTAASKPAYDLAFRSLRRRGTLVIVGLPKEDLTFFADDVVVAEARIVGSAVGTRAEQRELLGLATAGKVRCQVEAFPLEAVNEVFDRMRRGRLLGRAVLTF